MTIPVFTFFLRTLRIYRAGRGLTVCMTAPNVQITSFISEAMIKLYL
jgi:hypothetical protein